MSSDDGEYTRCLVRLDDGHDKHPDIVGNGAAFIVHSKDDVTVPGNSNVVVSTGVSIKLPWQTRLVILDLPPRHRSENISKIRILPDSIEPGSELAYVPLEVTLNNLGSEDVEIKRHDDLAYAGLYSVPWHLSVKLDDDKDDDDE